jgi:hypothetical protein
MCDETISELPIYKGFPPTSIIYHYHSLDNRLKQYFAGEILVVIFIVNTVKVAIPIGVNLFADQCRKTHEEAEEMSRVPYASAVSCLRYAMVCTILDIAHAVGVLRSYMSKPGKNHWTKVI